MSDVLLDGPSPADAACPASDTAEWLAGLLDTARDRGDAALSRLVAGVIDDLRAAKELTPRGGAAAGSAATSGAATQARTTRCQ